MSSLPIKPTFILQAESSFEVRALMKRCLTQDIPYARSTLAGLADESIVSMLDRGATPVGSVEFVRAALRLLQISEPQTVSYPNSLKAWFFRDIRCMPKAQIEHPRGTSNPIFVKPAGLVKQFGGFVLGGQYPEHEAQYTYEQEIAFNQLAPGELLYVSDPCTFLSEWRYYVLEGAVIGKARYDDGPDDEFTAPSPDDLVVNQMIASYQASAPVAYSIDVGTMPGGQTALIEVNDAWALGLYRDMQYLDGYCEMLTKRWHQICS